MTAPPLPLWLTLGETRKIAIEAFPGSLVADIEDALVRTFQDGQVRTRDENLCLLSPSRWARVGAGDAKSQLRRHGRCSGVVDWNQSSYWRLAPNQRTDYFESVKVCRGDLEEWIASAKGRDAKADAKPQEGAVETSTIGAETLCRRWLQGEVKKWQQNGGQRPLRDEMLRNALKKFPGLSKRSFLNRVWREETPEEWRRSGPKR